jgi:hypothetical protein
MKGHGPYSKILNWIQSEHAKSEFVSSVPPSPATLPEPRFQNLHRLTYHALGTLEPSSFSPGLLKLEIPLESRGLELDANVAGADVKHVLQTSGTPQMWTGYQSEVDVLMPHRLDNAPIRHASSLTSYCRPVDIRLSVQDFSPAPDATLPLVLQQYVTELDT